MTQTYTLPEDEALRIARAYGVSPALPPVRVVPKGQISAPVMAPSWCEIRDSAARIKQRAARIAKARGQA